MSEEIKMCHVFELPVQNDGNILQDKCGDHETIHVAKFTDLSSVVYATHAINNHDRLTEENKRLREALSHAYDLLLISGWDDYYADKIRLITGLLDGGEE